MSFFQSFSFIFPVEKTKKNIFFLKRHFLFFSSYSPEAYEITLWSEDGLEEDPSPPPASCCLSLPLLPPSPSPEALTPAPEARESVSFAAAFPSAGLPVPERTPAPPAPGRSETAAEAAAASSPGMGVGSFPPMMTWSEAAPTPVFFLFRRWVWRGGGE